MRVEDQIPSVMPPRFMLIGEAPGADEEYQGKPFVGKSGQFLNSLLTQVGINREECYVTNVVSERPEKNDFGIHYQDKQRRIPSDRLQGEWESLRYKIAQVSPTVVIALGNEALRAITGFKGIESRRGSIYQVAGVHVVSTFHPSAIIRGGGTSHWYKAAALHDLNRAKQVSSGQVQPRIPTLRLCNDPSLLDIYLGTTAETIGICAFDIETTYGGAGEWIKCIGFACSDSEGVVVPFPQDAGAEQLDLLAIIRKWMSSGQIRWIGQNAYNFDLPYIQRNWGFEVKGYAIDTMVLHHMLWPEFPHDLATISSFYTTIPFWKDTSDENLYQYNANDTVATFVSAMTMVEEARKRGMWGFYESYYHPLLTPLRKISQRGIRIDLEYQKEMKGTLREQIKGYQKELDAIYGKYTNSDGLHRRLKRVRHLIENGRKTVLLRGKRKRLTSMVGNIENQINKMQTLNVRSTKDLANFLYKVLALPVKTKKGKVTTDETALNQLFIKTNHPFLRTMITLRQKRNMLSRWGNLKTDEGLISTTYSFADTGRLRSGRFESK